MAEQIDALIRMRVTLMEQTAPQPAATATDRTLVSQRLAALQELGAFARQTVDGLIGAAPNSAIRMHMAETLMPVLAEHEQEIAVAYAALVDHPLVRADKDLERQVLAKLQSLADHHGARADGVGPVVEQARRQ